MSSSHIPREGDQGKSAPSTQGKSELPLDAAASTAEAQKVLHDLLETLWEQRKSSVVDRLHTLQEAIRALSQSPTVKSRECGIDAAHKLAGILGTFGLPRGTELARETEVALSQDGVLKTEVVAHLQEVVGELAQLIAQRTLPTAR